jgi:hypothetical protein
MARQKPTRAQSRRAAKDKVIEAARDLLRSGVICPRAGTSSYAVDGGKIDRLRATIQELDR